MYWFNACVDIESATDESSKGKQDIAVGYNEYAPIVTIPLRTDNLNLVSSSPCFNILLFPIVEVIVLLTNVNIINIDLTFSTQLLLLFYIVLLENNAY